MTAARLRRIMPVVFIICAAVIFVACAPLEAVVEFFSDDGTGHIFKIAIDSDPDCLDPQLAVDKNSVNIAKNLFAGLMDYDENGKLVCRLAEDYTVSNDGLKYTFYLKEGYKWHAVGDFEADVTAQDFVFGFRRLFDPKTASPHAEKYYCINGAEAAARGLIGTENIGVTAVDDYMLEFTLGYRNAEFLYLLAELPAMPCCEEFFETSGGKYGLEAEATCSNGPFYLRYWLHDPYGKNNYVRIRRNPGYSEMSYVSPAGVNYIVTPDAEERNSDFLNSATDAALFSGSSAAPIDGNEYICGYADTVGLIFNEKIKPFSNPEIRQIFSWAVDRETLGASSPDILLDAGGVVPKNPALSQKGYSGTFDPEVTASNKAMAEYKWSFVPTDSEKSELIGKTIMIPSDFGYGEYLSALTDCWYSVFGIHFAAEFVNPRDYENRLKSGDYDIALITLHSDSADPLDYIELFGSGEFTFRSAAAASAISERGRFGSMTLLNYGCSEAEKEILGEYHFIPIWQVPTVLCFDEDAQELRLDAFSGTVYFENAKMF